MRELKLIRAIYSMIKIILLQINRGFSRGKGITTRLVISNFRRKERLSGS
jgi:hypothetical protein